MYACCPSHSDLTVHSIKDTAHIHSFCIYTMSGETPTLAQELNLLIGAVRGTVQKSVEFLRASVYLLAGIMAGLAILLCITVFTYGFFTTFLGIVCILACGRMVFYEIPVAAFNCLTLEKVMSPLWAFTRFATSWLSEKKPVSDAVEDFWKLVEEFRDDLHRLSTISEDDITIGVLGHTIRRKGQLLQELAQKAIELINSRFHLQVRRVDIGCSAALSEAHREHRALDWQQKRSYCTIS